MTKQLILKEKMGLNEYLPFTEPICIHERKAKEKQTCLHTILVRIMSTQCMTTFECQFWK